MESSILSQIIKLDQDLLLFLNGLHQTWLDQPMFWISETKFWLPFYAFLLWQIGRSVGLKYMIGTLLAIALTITIADRTTSGFMKPYFERPRPSHEPKISANVHIVNDYRGGAYGFASSHAANTFGLAMLLYLGFRRRWRYVAFLFLWAAFVSYSRIYLGVHYPLDIVVGALVGMLGATLVYYVFGKINPKFFT